MDKQITIYHGSSKIIEKPVFGLGRKHNDFGLGFYCTENEELAKEWAISSLSNGFANRYTLETEDLNILYLNTPTYSILNWIAVLLDHRLFDINNPGAKRAKAYLSEHFGINVNAYDIIVGYRADDSYFDYAEAFINNTITVEQLSKAMELGKLGEQIVIKSEYAFSKIHFEGAEPADKSIYYILRKERDDSANQAYMDILEQEEDGLYIQNIIGNKITNDDPRLPRNKSK